MNVNIEEQLTEEEISKLEATTDSLTEDTENGGVTKVALIAIQKLPVNFDVENNVTFVKSLFRTPVKKATLGSLKKQTEKILNQKQV